MAERQWFGNELAFQNSGSQADGCLPPTAPPSRMNCSRPPTR
jgi:hypothetical protein